MLLARARRQPPKFSNRLIDILDRRRIVMARINPYSKEARRLIEECYKYLVENKITFIHCDPLLDSPIESFDW